MQTSINGKLSKLKDKQGEKPLNAGNQKFSTDQECQTKDEGDFVEILCTLYSFGIL